ncbi:MAG: hypothetical protein FWE58_06110 [Methanobrevibacter sp.]|nr:hypothetical protein [Methanobrevibacter sp.]
MEFYKKLLLSSVLLCVASMGIIILFAMNFNPIVTDTISINNDTEGGISGAIANASNGDIILLNSGNYTGINNTGITINKSITLKGKDPTDTVIIDAQDITRIFELDNNLNITFANIIFINANASGNGGAINNPNNNTRMKFIDCTFTNNKVAKTTNSDGFGGAIYNNGFMGLTDCTFNNINASSSGGAIYNNGSTIRVYDLELLQKFLNLFFNENNIKNSIDHGLVDCTFNNISASDSGGAIYNTGSGLGFVDCFFNDISADGDGGAVFNTGSGLGFVDCSFTNISASGSGGAVYNDGSGLGFVDCSFNDISASGSGGAVFNNGSGMGLVGSIFANISADGDGGAIFSDGSGLGFVDCSFTDISAGGDGGAIFSDGSGLGLVGSIFTNISAADGQTISGDNKVNGVDCTFINITTTNNRS